MSFETGQGSNTMVTTIGFEPLAPSGEPTPTHPGQRPRDTDRKKGTTRDGREFRDRTGLEARTTTVVETIGFEPTAPWLQTRCSARLSYVPGLAALYRALRAASRSQSIRSVELEFRPSVAGFVKHVKPFTWAHSSARLERIPDKDEVPGSNPGGPTSCSHLTGSTIFETSVGTSSFTAPWPTTRQSRTSSHPATTTR